MALVTVNFYSTIFADLKISTTSETASIIITGSSSSSKLNIYLSQLSVTSTERLRTAHILPDYLCIHKRLLFCVTNDTRVNAFLCNKQSWQQGPTGRPTQNSLFNNQIVPVNNITHVHAIPTEGWSAEVSRMIGYPSI